MGYLIKSSEKFTNIVQIAEESAEDKLIRRLRDANFSLKQIPDF